METFLTRLLEGCLIVWLVDRLLALLGLQPRTAKIVQVVVMILMLIWILLGGYVGLPIR